MEWIPRHINLIVEVFGAVTGLLYLYFSIRQNIWLWPLGFFTSAVYIFVFFQSKFYADMGLQVYYLAVSVYGWVYWTQGGKNDPSGGLPVVSVTGKMISGLMLVTGALFLLISFVLVRYTDSTLPFWDAFTTAASITATWMLARKILQHWLVWLVVDAVSMGLYLYKGLYPTVGLFLVYTLMAIKGYVEWRKDYLKYRDT